MSATSYGDVIEDLTQHHAALAVELLACDRRAAELRDEMASVQATRQTLHGKRESIEAAVRGLRRLQGEPEPIPLAAAPGADPSRPQREEVAAMVARHEAAQASPAPAAVTIEDLDDRLQALVTERAAAPTPIEPPPAPAPVSEPPTPTCLQCRTPVQVAGICEACRCRGYRAGRCRDCHTPIALNGLRTRCADCQRPITAANHAASKKRNLQKKRAARGEAAAPEQEKPMEAVLDVPRARSLSEFTVDDVDGDEAGTYGQFMRLVPPPPRPRQTIERPALRQTPTVSQTTESWWAKPEAQVDRDQFDALAAGRLDAMRTSKFGRPSAHTNIITASSEGRIAAERKARVNPLERGRS